MTNITDCVFDCQPLRAAPLKDEALSPENEDSGESCMIAAFSDTTPATLLELLPVVMNVSEAFLCTFLFQEHEECPKLIILRGKLHILTTLTAVTFRSFLMIQSDVYQEEMSRHTGGSSQILSTDEISTTFTSMAVRRTRW